MRMLICNDGSEQAERAMRFGALIAAGCQAEVTLLGIIESPGGSKAILDSLKRGQALLEDKKIHAELVTKSGKPLPEIIRRTEEAHYDLVVIGAVRKAVRGAFWMSSKSYRIIKEIKPPVLAVTGRCSGLNHILVCSGGKRYIDNAARLAGEIARSVGARVTLFHVLPEPPAIYAGLSRMEETAARLLESPSELGQNLRHTKQIFESLDVPVELRVRRGSTQGEILREIQEGEYDLIATGSALSHSLRTYVLGDITREIVNRADCAVLVARNQESPSGAGFSLWSLLRGRE